MPHSVILATRVLTETRGRSQHRWPPHQGQRNEHQQCLDSGYAECQYERLPGPESTECAQPAIAGALGLLYYYRRLLLVNDQHGVLA